MLKSWLLTLLHTCAGLCLPAAPRVRGEYRALFPAEAPDTESKAGKADLLAAFSRHLAEWGPMLQRFLRDEDDQVAVVALPESSSVSGHDVR